jgi:hypothetical protein
MKKASTIFVSSPSGHAGLANRVDALARFCLGDAASDQRRLGTFNSSM